MTFDSSKESLSLVFTSRKDNISSRKECLELLYRTIRVRTELFFGVDKDLDGLPSKRRIAPFRLRSGTEYLRGHRRNDSKETTSPGYGEISCKGFSRIIDFLQNGVMKALQMDENSSFLDIGSGYGKCVLHAKIQANVFRSVGVECIKFRHEKALEVLHFLNCNEHFEMNGVEFVEGDATAWRDRFDFTHIYCYDYIFSQHTHKALLPIIQRSPFLVLVCYSSPAKFSKLGYHSFEVLHKFSVSTTGKQRFIVYFYKKCGVMSPLKLLPNE